MTEDQARLLESCPGCGDLKSSGPAGLVVCWNCFKYISNPFKEYDGTLDAWIKEQNYGRN